MTFAQSLQFWFAEFLVKLGIGLSILGGFLALYFLLCLYLSLSKKWRKKK